MGSRGIAYGLLPPLITLGIGTLWPVEQVASHNRICGYFPSKEDAEAFVSMVSHLERQAGNTAEKRTV